MSGQSDWDVDFSLALRNRTGKFHVGQDILSAIRPRVHAVRYGRYLRTEPPLGRKRRIIELAGRLERKAIRAGLARGPRPPRPVLHLDPYTAVIYNVQEQDLFLCHDMGPLTHPELFAPQVVSLYQQAYSIIEKAGAGLVFVSKASRDAYAAHFSSGRTMEVIYPPIRASLSAATQIPVADVPEHFLLTVGSIGDRKNQAATIRAFAASGLAADGWAYVLCGPREPGAEAVERAASETPGVTLLPYVEDGALAWLYAHASGFVLLSLLEGFGVPVAEAMANGIVPLVSRGSVLEEVAGPGALASCPTSPTEMADGLRGLATLSKPERARRASRFAPALARFTPEAFGAGWAGVLD